MCDCKSRIMTPQGELVCSSCGLVWDENRIAFNLDSQLTTTKDFATLRESKIQNCSKFIYSEPLPLIKEGVIKSLKGRKIIDYYNSEMYQSILIRSLRHLLSQLDLSSTIKRNITLDYISMSKKNPWIVTERATYQAMFVLILYHLRSLKRPISFEELKTVFRNSRHVCFSTVIECLAFSHRLDIKIPARFECNFNDVDVILDGLFTKIPTKILKRIKESEQNFPDYISRYKQYCRDMLHFLDRKQTVKLRFGKEKLLALILYIADKRLAEKQLLLENNQHKSYVKEPDLHLWFSNVQIHYPDFKEYFYYYCVTLKKILLVNQKTR